MDNLTDHHHLHTPQVQCHNHQVILENHQIVELENKFLYKAIGYIDQKLASQLVMCDQICKKGASNLSNVQECS